MNTGLTSNLVNALVIDPSAPGTLYAGTQLGGVVQEHQWRGELERHQHWSEQQFCRLGPRH